MNAYDLISIVLAFILFCFECFILYNISSVIQFLAWHSITLLILVAFLYWVYRQKENLLYPLLLLVSALGAGPFGLGAFFLMAILRPVFSLFASSTALWFEGLFPEKNLPLFEEITQRIKSRWDDYSHQSETSSFPNLFTYGSLSDKQKVLDAIIENFQPSYSLILKEALKDPENVVRIQAAAIITKINTDFENKMKRLEKLHLESPKDLDILLQLAEHLGDATQNILGPLARLLHSEIKSMWAYYEAGFHNLLVVSIEERYQKEAMKTALGLMGTQQLSLTKCLITVSENVDPRNFRDVLHAVRDNFDPQYDFILLPKVPLDTLDFTSYSMNLGSKMILDATKKKKPQSKLHVSKKTEAFIHQLAAHDRRIIETNLIAETLLLVKVKHDGASVVRKLLKSAMLDGIKLVAAVSEDVDIHDQESYIWGVFTRFDCERDVIFTQQKLVGISPVYKGTMGIDATWKDGYPEPLAMDEKIVKLVDDRWDSYWK